jgi:hypothetical protein
MEQTYCDLVLVTMSSTSLTGPKVVELIRSRASDLLVRPPDIHLLFNNSLPIPDVLRCREIGASSMRRDLPPAIYEEVRISCWKRATRKHDVTVRIDYRNGHHSLFVGSPPTSVELGAQLTHLAVLLLSGNECYTVQYLADELEICRQSVKKYICELRRIFFGMCGRYICWMERRPGGTVCGIKANAIWI